MWNWANDGELLDAFSSLSKFEKSLLFFWACLPIVTLGSGLSPSQTYLLATSLLNIFGLNYTMVYTVIQGLALILIFSNRNLLCAMFKAPQCNFDFLKDKWRYRLACWAVILMIFSAFLLWWRPEILITMRGLTDNAKVPDWMFSAVKEELTDRFIFYYAIVLLSGRSGGLLFSMLFFAIFHDYNHAYMVNMILAGSFHVFLLLWSGSLSLPILVHILSNSAIFFFFKFLS